MSYRPELYSEKDATRLGLPSNAARLLADSYVMRVAVLIIIHILLGLTLWQRPLIATLHALIVFCAGAFFLVRDEHLNRLIILCAYLTGAELLWRIDNAAIFWESGKYAICVFLLLALIKHRRLGQVVRWPILFFVLLLPSLFLLPTFDREVISFYLSGPLSLAVAVMFFSTTQLQKQDIQPVLLALFLPVLGAAVQATFSTITAPNLVFGRSSLAVTSGGYGPNQVSSILGLGALVAVFFILLHRKHLFLRLSILLCGIWFVAQAALTFSRGGIYTTLGALAAAALYLLRDRRSRLTFLILVSLVALLWTFFVFPRLDTFTGGALAYRLRDTDPTGRDKIVQADLLAFWENPLAGVGPGQSRSYHALLFRSSNTHTEFSRWLAEHGSLGFIALLIFIGAILHRAFQPMPPLEKALALSLMVWTILFMSHAAMRLVAPSFAFGLAFASIQLDSKTNSDD